MELGEVLSKFLDAIRPEQVCWLCLFLTLAGSSYAVATFADASDVSALSARMDEQRAFDLRVEQCRTIKEGKNATRYTLELQQVLRRYREATGADYRVPNCDELT